MQPEQGIECCNWDLRHVTIVVSANPAMQNIVDVLNVKIVLHRLILSVQLRRGSKRRVSHRDGEQSVHDLHGFTVLRIVVAEPRVELQVVLHLGIVDDAITPGIAVRIDVFFIRATAGVDATAVLEQVRKGSLTQPQDLT